MTICKLSGLGCDCQPDEGVPCSAEGDGLKKMMLGWRHEAIRLQSLLPTVPEQAGWRPIETAPKDETVILVGYLPNPRLEPSRHVYEGRWNASANTWTSVNGFLIHDGATHWMPLPPAPTPKEPGQA